MLDLMCQYESFDEGILHEYYVHEGWYDESPWEITNLESTVSLFRSFSLQRVNEKAVEASPNIVDTLPAVACVIAKFLEQANCSEGKVYIVYD